MAANYGSDHNAKKRVGMKIITIHTVISQGFANERIRFNYDGSMYRTNEYGVEYQLDSKGYLIPWGQIKMIVTSYGDVNDG